MRYYFKLSHSSQLHLLCEGAAVLFEPWLRQEYVQGLPLRRPSHRFVECQRTDGLQQLWPRDGQEMLEVHAMSLLAGCCFQFFLHIIFDSYSSR